MMSAAASRVFARCFLGSLLLLSRVSDAAPVDLSRLPAPADKKVNFSEDIQPLFAKHCYNCHGPEKQRNNFRLDQKAAAFKGGDDFAPDIIPGKSAESPLIHLVAGLIKDKVMPQKGERLSTQEIAILRAWIDQGAQWPDVLAGSDPKEKARLWALEPLQQPALPTVKKPTWAQNSVDTFVLAKLESKGLSPSRPADKATLIRRTSYALTGLPPSPNEVEAFMRDTSPKAFEKVVDRYLASPRYGERWGRHWLDLVRFCESHGFEYDKIRDHAWRYRDYVIESFNNDKPYSEFIKEQLAGDALKPQSTERIVATGFLVCAPWDEAGNNQVGKTMKARVREEEIEDMVAVVGQTFLGLTVNCARCHDHKFDPIPQRDYYALKAALAGVRHGNRSLLTEAELKARDAEKAKVLAQLKELEKAASMFEDIGRKRLQANANPRKNLEGLEPVQPRPLACWTFDGTARDSIGGLHGELKGSAVIKDGRLRLDGKTAYLETSPLQEPLREKTLEAWVSLTDLEQSGGAVMTVELNGNGDKFDSIVYGERDKHQWVAGSEFFKRSLPLDAPPETAKPGELLHMALVCSADNSIRIYRNGELLGKPYIPTPAENATLQEYPAGKTRVMIGLRHHGAKNGFLAGEIEEARLYNRALSSAEIKASLKSGPRVYTTDEILASLTASEKEIYHRNDKERAKLSEQLNKLANPPQAYAANSKKPEPTFILRRGDVEKPREQVGAGALSCLSDLPPDFHLAEDAPEAERRLKLAEWITSPRNPLTPRVLVNRVWHYHFGRGLVSTPNDFGANSEKPSHPELLDWLASEFRRSGGSIKALHRLILLSSTYQQSGRDAKLPEQERAAQLDGEDRQLWHFPIRRLEAEEVRDSILWLSGNLNLEAAGPGFRPFNITINNSYFYNLVDRSEPEFNRRSVYRVNVQSGRDPLLDSLDCPDPSTKTPSRAVTTTPIQSLGLMNSSFVQRQAGDFAARLEREAGKELENQIKLAWKLAYARKPEKNELKRAGTFAAENGMPSLCWVVLNSSELLYVK